MKTITFFLMVVIGLSSCSTYKDIAKHTQLTESVIRSKMVPGKDYQIKLNSGQLIEVKVTGVDSLNVYGMERVLTRSGTITRDPFSDSFVNLQQNANRISIKKLNPWLTAAVIVVPIGLLYGIALNSLYSGW